jgi:hypothetical protein
MRVLINNPLLNFDTHTAPDIPDHLPSNSNAVPRSAIQDIRVTDSEQEA